ncbi:MAG: metallophosphoesterase [Bacteroidales bacterium]|nr:metallophosphoesterase [Bacteroidales bacterium]
MKIQYASDLHLEFEQNKQYIEQGGIKPVGDVLVLAGDVSYLGDRKAWKRPFWDWCAEHFRETFVVPGNHEFYGGYDIGRTMADYELELRPNVHYLNNRSIVLDDVELFFTTLWTRIDPVWLWQVQRGMNDYRLAKLSGMRFCANDVDGLHQRCLDWLSGTLAASVANHKIVVTHHCPTMRNEFKQPSWWGIEFGLSGGPGCVYQGIGRGILDLWAHALWWRFRYQDWWNNAPLQPAGLRVPR